MESCTIMPHRHEVENRSPPFFRGVIAYVPDISQEPHRIARHAAEKDVQSSIAVPVAHGGRCVGMMYLASERKDDFGRSDEIILSMLASAVAQVLTVGAAAMDFDDMIGHVAACPRVAERDCQLYRAKVDQYVAILEDVSDQWARAFGIMLQKALSSPPIDLQDNSEGGDCRDEGARGCVKRLYRVPQRHSLGR